MGRRNESLGIGVAALVVWLSAAPASGLSEKLDAPAGEALTYGVNASRTGVSTDPAIAGPMRRGWVAEFDGSTNTPLVAGGKVLVNVSAENGPGGYGSRIAALDPATGKELWSAATPGTYFTAPIGADAERVYSMNRDGDLRAFSLETGEALWEATLANTWPEASPVAIDGVVYVSAPVAGSAYKSVAAAFSAADGSLLWSTPLFISGSGASGPALDEERMYVVDACASVVALSRSNGQILWQAGQAGTEETSCSHGGGRAIVSDGQVLTGGGSVYSAIDGSPLGKVPDPGAVLGDLSYGAGERLSATSIATGEQTWKRKFGTGFGAAPVIVGRQIFVAANERVSSFDTGTGKPLTSLKLPEAGHVAGGGVQPGVSAGAGRVLVAHGVKVFSVVPVFHPEPGEIDSGASAFDIVAGKRVSVAGVLGADLRATYPRTELLLGRAPKGRLRAVAKGSTLGDGGSYFRVRVGRNTRVSIGVAGTKVRSDPLTVYAYPDYKFDFETVSATVAIAHVTVGKVPKAAVQGERLSLYLRRASSDRLKRLGSARLHATGSKSARADVRFRRLGKVGRKDTIVGCVKGLAQRGFGRNDSFQRQCGDAHPTIRGRAAGPQNRSAHRLRIRHPSGR